MKTFHFTKWLLSMMNKKYAGLVKTTFKSCGNPMFSHAQLQYRAS